MITYDPSLRMPLTPAICDWMDALWLRKLALARERGIPLFDAPLFRLVSATVHADNTLHLILGNTSYKEYVTTREPEFAAHRERQELSNVLAVCSVIETCDGFILLDKRQGVDVYAGRYHVIGGFFERERDTTTSPDPFQAMRREIREETGVLPTDIVTQVCLGAVYDLATPHGELCFLTRLHIPLAEVRARTPEDDEVKEVQSLATTSEGLRAFILAHHGNISATGEPNLLMYGALKFGEPWFEDLMQEMK